MTTVNDIFRDYAPAYLERYADSIPAEHKKVIDAILRCRTESNGSTLYRCEACGETHRLHRCCGNRHCPLCQHHKTRQWLETQIRRQLPTHHFLLTFTVPEAIRPFIRSHQRTAYDALFHASANAMKTLAPDPKYLGADNPGFFGVLHTWGRLLQYHPHIHYLAPGGAFASHNSRWHPAAIGFYLPVRALSRIYRAKFRDRIENAGLLPQIPTEVWKSDWNVNCQAVGNPEATLKYLAPYLFRVAISNGRIVRVEQNKVFLRYRKPHSERPRIMALEVMEFMRRFLQHVLPTGFVKVRYFGFLHPSFFMPLAEIKARIEAASGFRVTTPEAKTEPAPPLTCPHCGGILKYHRSILPARRPLYSMAPLPHTVALPQAPPPG